MQASDEISFGFVSPPFRVVPILLAQLVLLVPELPNSVLSTYPLGVVVAVLWLLDLREQLLLVPAEFLEVNLLLCQGPLVRRRPK